MEAKPRCPHDQSPLNTETLYGVQIDRCPDCAGVWLDKGELEALQELAAASGPLPDAPNEVHLAFAMAREKDRPTGLCPTCSGELDRTEYLRGSQVLAEVCAQGHGLWLNAGELTTLEVFFAEQRREVEVEDTGLRAIWASLVAVIRGD